MENCTHKVRTGSRTSDIRIIRMRQTMNFGIKKMDYVFKHYVKIHGDKIVVTR